MTSAASCNRTSAAAWDWRQKPHWLWRATLSPERRVRRRSIPGCPWDADVGNAAACEGGADGLIDDVRKCAGPITRIAVDRHVHEQLDEVHVLLVVGVDQVGESVPRDCQHGWPSHLASYRPLSRWIPPAPRCQADAEGAGVLGMAASREGGRLLMPHLDELDFFLVRAQGLKDAVDAIAGESRRSCPLSIRSDGRSAYPPRLSPSCNLLYAKSEIGKIRFP